MLSAGLLAFCLSETLYSADLKSIIEMPDASKILKKDRLAPPKKYVMPKECITTDPLAIARGEYIFMRSLIKRHLRSLQKVKVQKIHPK